MAMWQFVLLVVIILVVNVAAWTILYRKLKDEFARRFESLESADKRHMREQSRISEEQSRLLEEQESLRAQHTGAIASLQRTISELSRVIDGGLANE
jgi:predicted Holliday junction resolvase-like endonuclease